FGVSPRERRSRVHLPPGALQEHQVPRRSDRRGRSRTQGRNTGFAPTRCALACEEHRSCQDTSAGHRRDAERAARTTARTHGDDGRRLRYWRFLVAARIALDGASAPLLLSGASTRCQAVLKLLAVAALRRCWWR